MTTRAKVCRICMTGTTKGVISLFSVCNGSIRIYDKVMEVANVQISEEDGLPVWICYSCLVHLETSYQFKIQAEKSDQLFRNQLEASQKEADVVVIDDNTKFLQAISNTGVQCIMPSEQLPSSVGQKPSVDIESENFIHENTTQNDENTNQEHFMSLSKGMGDDHSNDQNGIKITNVMSQAEQEVMNMPCTETCTCIEGQDGTITSKCEACTKIPRGSKTSAEVQIEGSPQLTCNDLTTSLQSDVITNNGHLNVNSSFLATKGYSNDKSYDVFDHNFEETPDDESKFFTKKIETASNRHKCRICSKGFKRISHLYIHMRIHNNVKIPKSDGIHKCPICDEGFQFKTLLKLHIMTHDGIKPYKCDRCAKKFKFEEHLRLHKTRHIEESLFKCDICEKTFKHKIHLSNHMFCHSDQSGVCEHCGKFYSSYSGLNSHKKFHHSITPKMSIQCEHCRKTFASEARLKIHVRTHTINPVTCEICDNIYPNKTRLRKHKQLVHSDNPKLQCSICKRTFKNSSTLRVHKKFKHSNREKPMCAMCNLTFSQPQALKTHIKIIHSGLRPHSCKHCKLDFKWRQSRDKHELKCLENKSESDSDGDSEAI